MLSKLTTKVAAWIICKAFIYISKHVTFSDFTKIYNEAYRAHVEGEWKKMSGLMIIKGQLNPQNPIPQPCFIITKSQPEDLVDCLDQTGSAPQSRRTWPQPEPNDGRDEVLQHSQE